MAVVIGVGVGDLAICFSATISRTDVLTLRCILLQGFRERASPAFNGLSGRRRIRC